MSSMPESGEDAGLRRLPICR